MSGVCTNPSISEQNQNFQRFPQGNVKYYHNNINYFVFEELNNTETNRMEQTY